MTFEMMRESYFAGHQVCETVWSVFCLVLRLDLAESSVRMEKKERRGQNKEEDEIDGWKGELPKIHNHLSLEILVKGS